MTTEQIIEQVGTALEDLSIETINDETKLAALNKANDVLYPLKEQGIINDFQFTSNVIGEVLNISVFIKENAEDEFTCWDLSLVDKG
jgi:hypothetical protein